MYCKTCGRPLPIGMVRCPNCGWSSTPSLVVPPLPAKESSNAAVIAIGIAVGVLGFIMVVGIIAAIAIPNLLTAIQRGKQKRTMSDMRSISVAVQAYQVDQGQYPQASSMADLSRLLAPKYIKVLPMKDAWEHSFRYLAWHEGDADRFALGSAGKDGQWENDELSAYESGPTVSYDSDLVLADGEFVRLPESKVAGGALPSRAGTGPGRLLKFENLNFSFQSPASPWVQMDAKKMNPDAALFLMRTHPQVYFFIIAEITKQEVDSGALLEVVKGNLKSAAPDAQVLEEKPYRVKELMGTRIVSRATVEGTAMIYVHWVVSTGRDAYQLITVGPVSEEQAVRSESAGLLSQFSLLQTPAAAPEYSGR